jgi:hypothetical protein
MMVLLERLCLRGVWVEGGVFIVRAFIVISGRV